MPQGYKPLGRSFYINERQITDMETKWERLSPNHKILVSKEHTFNTDTILLADFSQAKKHYVCADIGTGCGTIAALWAIRKNPKTIYALEIQENAFNQFKSTVEENGFANIKQINGDVKNFKEIFKAGSLDLIACNPPYKEKGTGIKNPEEGKMIARHEEHMSLEDLAKAASFALKFGGRLCICQRPERLSDAICIFKEYKLEPKRLRLVQQRESKAPFLFLLELRNKGNSGMTVMPTLFIEKDGEFSPEMIEIYGDYKEKNDE